MISFNTQPELEFSLNHANDLKNWITQCIHSYSFELGDIDFVFCTDSYLHNINVEFLNHNTLTDIISFDYKVGNQLHGEIYISIPRVEENANDFKVSFEDELHRVIIHGILHFCGLKDKSKEEEIEMRTAEDKALKERQFL